METKALQARRIQTAMHLTGGSTFYAIGPCLKFFQNVILYCLKIYLSKVSISVMLYCRCHGEE